MSNRISILLSLRRNQECLLMNHTLTISCIQDKNIIKKNLILKTTKFRFVSVKQIKSDNKFPLLFPYLAFVSNLINGKKKQASIFQVKKKESNTKHDKITCIKHADQRLKRRKRKIIEPVCPKYV